MTQIISLNPIGNVCSPVKERTDTGWGSVTAGIELKAEYRDGLTGLESFSHAIIVTYLHQARYDPEKHLKRRPQNREDMPLVGILSQRAKNRPNPLGITVVEILEVGHYRLSVRGLDAIDGTPVLDIKPYFPVFDRVDDPRSPSWVDDLMKNYF